MRNKTNNTTRIGEYQLAHKRYNFDPLLRSLMQQALYKLRATVGKLSSLRVQRVIKLCEWVKTRRETTVPQSSLKSGHSQATIPGKLLTAYLLGHLRWEQKTLAWKAFC